MSNLAPLTEAEIKEFVADWYRKLDVHAPLEDYIPLLVEKGFVLTVPEFTVEGWEGFKGWYQRAIGLFFDEVHTIKQVKLASVDGEKAEVKVIVYWEATRWQPPAAKSDRILMDAYQTWTLTRSPKTQKPVIAKYVVDSAEYAEGSARL
jgi:hypothetical protein